MELEKGIGRHRRLLHPPAVRHHLPAVRRQLQHVQVAPHRIHRQKNVGKLEIIFIREL